MEHGVELSLDEQGRIVIPWASQSRLGLSPGMTLVVEKGHEDELCLRIETEPPVLVDKQGVLVVHAMPIYDIADVTRHERDRRVFTLLQRVGL